MAVTEQSFLLLSYFMAPLNCDWISWGEPDLPAINTQWNVTWVSHSLFGVRSKLVLNNSEKPIESSLLSDMRTEEHLREIWEK